MSQVIDSGPLLPSRSQADSDFAAYQLAARVAFVLLPPLCVAAVLAANGMRGTTEAVEEWMGASSEVAWLITFGFPVLWLMFSPVFVVPGSLRRSKTPMRDYFTEELAAAYSPDDFSMATGAHNSTTFDVRDIDDNPVADAKIPMSGRGMTVRVGDKEYRVTWEREAEPSALLEASRYWNVLRVYGEAVAENQTEEPLIVYRRPHFIREPHFIELAGSERIELRPNPPCAFPNRYDMLIDGEKRGQVIKPGKWLFRGVIMLTPDLPPNVRSVLASLCYYMMK